jgi:hypothetical protein
MNKLAERTGKLPSTLFIDDVRLESSTSIAHGGFADIYRGKYEGNLVAVKRPRVYESEKSEFYEVCSHAQLT